ncbi:hypothetical protein Tcan_07991 [Toxocara canis]|uniref:Uncharacterized protein n=1 Tax=Toxocara canis TaxID=6265 RepID=A0A0B2VDE9_TOXCA|nr:hypothetical protein Tcan_07991 [Toxocara canis]
MALIFINFTANFFIARPFDELLSISFCFLMISRNQNSISFSSKVSHVIGLRIFAVFFSYLYQLSFVTDPRDDGYRSIEEISTINKDIKPIQRVASSY